jgi:hypothetical protein
LDNSRSIQVGHEDDDGSDDFEPRLGSESESENRSASKTAEVTVVIQDQDNNHNNNGEAEEDHNGSDESDDEDDDEGTRTYWRVKAKEGHKVSVCVYVCFFVAKVLYSARKKKVTLLSTFAFFSRRVSAL